VSQATIEATATAIADAFVVRDGGVHCAACGHRYGDADRDPKLGAVMSERSITDLSPLNAVGFTDRLVARHFFCPSCALLIAVNVQEQGDPIMLEWRLDA
jgi:N-methylhydantoinase B